MTAPVQTHGPLFEAVQRASIFVDGKTFVDAVARRDGEEVLAAFLAERDAPDFDLEAFVRREFELPASAETGASSLDLGSVRAYIRTLWERLERDPDPPNAPAADPRRGTLLPLEHPYVVPGGRFREIYYWDSYFTALGLVVDGRSDLVEGMARNFLSLRRRLSWIPNGNRSYLRHRSQPPVLSLYLDLLWKEGGWGERDDRLELLEPFLDGLEGEIAYWTTGSRVLRGPGGELLSRYHDDVAAPREESWCEDVELAARAGATGEAAERLWGHVRAGAASGWDFSSRWQDAPGDATTNRCGDVAPVCLASLLYAAEDALARYREERGEREAAERWRAAADARADVVRRRMWSEARGLFTDWDAARGEPRPQETLAALWPLYVGIATPAQAAATAARLEADFLAPGGLRCTLARTGEQWDAPNGWAPLHELAVGGLERYGHRDLAAEIRRRWLALVERRFERDRCLLEKYDVEDVTALPGGGEYTVQEGFGWTNGVTLRFLVQEGRA